MRRSILLVWVMLSLAGCRDEQKDSVHEISNSKPAYPAIIDSLGVQKQFDKTKWLLYCICCDDTLRFQPQLNIKDQVTFGMLDLAFDTLLKREDSIELNFTFYYKGFPCNGSIIRNPTIMGAVYKLPYDSVLDYSNPSVARYISHSCPTGDCHSRYINPLQPEVIKYIQENKTKLNAWFVQEAKRRGVLP